MRPGYNLLPHSHDVPGVGRTGEGEDVPGFREEAAGVSRVVPVTHHDALLIARHHEVLIDR